MSLGFLVRERRILVCVGSGGVGKTTTSAAFALGGARAGRRTLVMTIDPARRLANSLGLAGLDHEEQRVPDEKIAPAGEKVAGSLHAMMLDQKRAFDEITDRYIPDPAARVRVRQNRIYQQVSSTLAGSHEYAAMAKLWSVAGERRYDLIVLDTPPTENALDFLDAPEKLVGAVDSPALQWFAKLYFQHSLKVLGVGGAFVLKRLARFVGSRFLEDVGQFVGENGAMLEGLRERAREVQALLRGPDVGFVLVCSPEPLSVAEALYFNQRLQQQRMPLGGFVVNRVHPKGPPPTERQTLIDLLAARSELRGFDPDDTVQVAADLDRTYRDFQALAEIDAREVERLVGATRGAPHVEVPLFDRDIYDIEGLTLINQHLIG
jgi:anion-transporting  ArsA/GET3 family ATPase